MQQITNIIIAAIPSIICGICLAVFNRKANKREAEANAKAEARQKESLLALEMQNATAKLALASAMALKRGHANGEVEEGVKAYESASQKYENFLREQAYQNIQK